MKRSWLIWVIGFGLVGVLAWRMLPRNDERAIRRNLRDAVQALEKDGPENPIAAARRAERAADIFVPNPIIEGRGLDARWRSRTELRSGIFQVRAAAERLSISLHDISVKIETSGEQAVLSGTARVRGAGTHGRGSLEQEFVEFTTEWVKTPDGWRLAVLRRVDAIRNPQYQ